MLGLRQGFYNLPNERADWSDFRHMGEIPILFAIATIWLVRVVLEVRRHPACSGWAGFSVELGELLLVTLRLVCELGG